MMGEETRSACSLNSFSPTCSPKPAQTHSGNTLSSIQTPIPETWTNKAPEVLNGHPRSLLLPSPSSSLYSPSSSPTVFPERFPNRFGEHMVR